MREIQTVIESRGKRGLKKKEKKMVLFFFFFLPCCVLQFHRGMCSMSYCVVVAGVIAVAAGAGAGAAPGAVVDAA
jgi:hypothetical protein